jgi:stearoyl-CoA desaturase (delta-9 desaturase)
VLVAMIDVRALLYAYLVPAILVYHGSSLINTLNHSKFGYRNYDTKDLSYNNPVTGIFMAGEGWHNSHHHDPKNPKFGEKWYEFDLGWHVIQLIRTDK